MKVMIVHKIIVLQINALPTLLITEKVVQAMVLVKVITVAWH